MKLNISEPDLADREFMDTWSQMLQSWYKEMKVTAVNAILAMAFQEQFTLKECKQYDFYRVPNQKQHFQVL